MRILVGKGRIKMLDAAAVVGAGFVVVGLFSLLGHMFGPGDRMTDIVFIAVGACMSIIPLMF